MANVGPSVWYLNSVAYTAVAGWTANHSYAPGALIRPVTFTALSERVFANVTASTSNSTSNVTTEPIWTYTKGALQPLDGAVFWMEVTGQPGVNGDLANTPTWAQQHLFSTTITAGLIIQDSASGTASLWIARVGGTIGSSAPGGFSTATAGTSVIDNSSVTWISLGAASSFGIWAAPFDRWQSAYGTNWMGVINTCYVSDNHNESQSAAMTVTMALQNALICIDHTVSLPPTASNLTTGAVIATTGANALTAQVGGNSFGYVYGVTFQCGSGAVNSILSITGSPLRLDNCKLQKLGTTAQQFAISLTGADLVNTTVKFGAVGDSLNAHVGTNRWRNTPSALDTAGAIPTTALVVMGGGAIEMSGLDLTGLGVNPVFISAANNTNPWSMFNCALASGGVVGTPGGYMIGFFDALFSDSAATTYQQARNGLSAALSGVINVYRTGGASNGVVNYSWFIATNANGRWLYPFEAFPIIQWNTVLNTNRVVTIHGIVNAAIVPTNDEVWMDVSYMGSSSTPIASVATNGKATILSTGTALTADTTSVWNAPARANSTPYSVGAAIQVTGSTGPMVFFCIASTGNSAASLPGGYASAVDGGSVTDGSCTFRAGCRFSMAVTLSSPQPKIVGDITAQVYFAKPAIWGYYLDPIIFLS